MYEFPLNDESSCLPQENIKVGIECLWDKLIWKNYANFETEILLND